MTEHKEAAELSDFDLERVASGKDNNVAVAGPNGAVVSTDNVTAFRGRRGAGFYQGDRVTAYRGPRGRGFARID